MNSRIHILMMFSCVALTGCFGFVPHDIQSPKPYLEYWEKAGMIPDSRMQVSASCGGGLSDRPQPSQRQIKEFQKQGENNGQTYSRLFREWQRCMIKNGYRYTGECHNNEISRASPACGAP